MSTQKKTLGGNGSANPAGSGPANPAGNSPANPAGNSPANPAGNGPANPAGNGPANPAGNSPANPAGNSPANPGGNGPANPGGNKPIKKDKEWRKKRRKEFWIWFSMNIFVAGWACIILLLLKDHFLGHKGWFYVLNKEGYSGYFYAWSIALIAGSLFSLLKCWVDGRKSNGKIWLVILSILLLCVVVGSYLSHNEQAESLSVERIVKDLDVKKLVGKKIYNEFKHGNGRVDADSLFAIINKSENKRNEALDYFDHIDKEQLYETLLPIKLKFEDPGLHWNWLYIALTFLSVLVAWFTFYWTYPKPEDDK